MKRKNFLVIAACAAAVLCMAMAVLFFSKHHVKEYKGIMMINGESMESDKITFCIGKETEYIQLPLLIVLEKVGCDIEWETSERANINTPGGRYILDFKSKTLTESNQDNNLLIPSPGCRSFVCDFLSDDVLVDDVTLKSVCSFMNIQISIDVDYVQHAVSLKSM